MARPKLVYCNTSALQRTYDLALQSGADPADLLGVKRALEAQNRQRWRWTMLIKHGFREVHAQIRAHARHKLYTTRLFDELLATSDDQGLRLFEADELAAELEIPRQAIYTALLDLEREPIAAVTRIMKGRHVRGIELTAKVIERPDPKKSKPKLRAVS